jgi:predicted O-methyltransferase YrrM
MKSLDIINIITYNTMNKFNYSNPPKEFIEKCPEYLKKVYEDNKIFGKKISSETKPYECINLYNLIYDNNIDSTLEIGMAQGFSSAWICKAHSDKKSGSHTSIDPFQESQWENIGMKLIDKCGYTKMFNIIQEKSFIALPKLLGAKYGLVYIDGFHTFDYTLVDFFYADNLLKVGGFIVIDDTELLPVKTCVEYIKFNYKHYRKIKSVPTQAIFQKIDEDQRLSSENGWKFHRNF